MTRRLSAGPDQGSPQDACTPPPHCSYCSFILLCFCLQTTFFLSLGCWLQAALPGFAPGLAGRETWAGPGAGVQGVLLGGCPWPRPSRGPVGHWGPGEMSVGAEAVQLVRVSSPPSPPPGFLLCPGPAAPPRVISAPASRAWGFRGISGSPMAGAGTGAVVSHALAAGTFPFFAALAGRPWNGREAICLSLPPGCSFCLPPERSCEPGEGGEGPGPGRAR